MNRNRHTYRLTALTLALLLMPGWYAIGMSFCDSIQAEQHHSDECCESGDKASSDNELPRVTELNSDAPETDYTAESESSCDEDGEYTGSAAHSSEGDCNCCDKCEITSGAQAPVNGIEEARTLDTHSAETYLYEYEILLLPDHHQVAALHNVADDRSSPPLYVMNQVFLN